MDEYSSTAYENVQRIKSGAARALCIIFTVVIIGLLLLVTGYLIWLGISGLSVRLFTEIPSGNITGDIGGMKPAMIGTIILIAMASVVGVPVGVMTGVYLSEYEAGGWLAAPVRFTCDVLAGVPSIVVGILGYELLVRPLLNWDGHLTLAALGVDWKIMPNGTYNAWAGAAALGFIMVPIIARTTEEMLRLVPNSYREAAIGLGATKAQTIVQVVIPAATGSLVTGIMLAVARVAGETAPLLYTVGTSRYNPISFDGSFPFIHVEYNEPFPSLTTQIFSYASSSYPEQNTVAWGGLLVLIALIFVLNISIRFATRGKTSK